MLMGTSGVPGTTAMATVGAETKTPMISLTPAPAPQHANGQWMISIPQPPPLMVAAVVESHEERERQEGRLHRLLGFWGDLVYDGLMKNVQGSSIQVVTERALRPCRYVGHRPGAEDRRLAARRGDHRRLRHARRAALHRVAATRLQGRPLRHARADQSGFRPCRRRRGRRRCVPDRSGGSSPSSCPTPT